MFSDYILRNTLHNNSNIVAVVDTYEEGEDDYPCIHEGFNPDFPLSKKTIAFHRQAAIQGGLNYGLYDYQVDCRAMNEQDSMNIAETVYTELNRNLTNDGIGLCICDALVTIPPVNADIDNYNTPVFVRIKSRRLI